MDSVTPGTLERLEAIDERCRQILASVPAVLPVWQRPPTQREIRATIARWVEMARQGEPASVRVWWGGLPEFSPNPDKV